MNNLELLNVVVEGSSRSHAEGLEQVGYTFYLDDDLCIAFRFYVNQEILRNFELQAEAVFDEFFKGPGIFKITNYFFDRSENNKRVAALAIHCGYAELILLSNDPRIIFSDESVDQRVLQLNRVH